MSFHHTILLLSLAIGLRVQGGKKLLFDAQKVVQGELELGYEYWSAVADNRVEQTVVSNLNIKDDFCQRRCSYWYLYILVVYHLY